MPSIDRQPPGDGRGRGATPRNLSAYRCVALPRAPRRVPLSGEDRGAWEERDRALLARIADARLRGDERQARLAAGELLVPYLPAVEALVARRTARTRLQKRDREEISSGALERLAWELVCEPDLHGASFGAIVTVKVASTITDFLRARSRHAHERLTAPEELPEPFADAELPPFEQAEAVEAILRALAPHEQEIVYERYVLDRSIGEVAVSRGIQPDSVKKACTRGARKIREARRAREAHEARKAREAREAREADEGRLARKDPEASKAGSMSTFSTSPSE